MFNTPNYNYNYPWNNYNSQASAAVPQQPQPQPQPLIINPGINWIQSEAEIKNYIPAAGQTVLFMDSENDVFYIKYSDASGRPMPLRIFDYTERVRQKQPSSQNNDYITRKEFEKRLSELKNAKQSVSTT